jgi:chemotaxis protein MotA
MGFIGILIVIGGVFGGYFIEGGTLHVFFHSAPPELMIIMGAAFGGYVIGNPMKTVKLGIKLTLKGLTSKGPQKQDYIELLQMMFQLFQLFRKDGPQAVEKHIENPEKSEIFTAYPSFMRNHHASAFLCDTMKVTLSADLTPYDVDDLLDQDIRAIHAEEHAAQHAIQTMGDGIPGLGIVAAVLGIVITMSKLNEGTQAIGNSVAGALVGTMLGVFLCYGFVGPFALKIQNDLEAEGRYLFVIKQSLVALQRGSPPIVCIEYARRSILPEERPNFQEVERATKEIKKAA